MTSRARIALSPPPARADAPPARVVGEAVYTLGPRRPTICRCTAPRWSRMARSAASGSRRAMASAIAACSASRSAIRFGHWRTLAPRQSSGECQSRRGAAARTVRRLACCATHERPRDGSQVDSAGTASGGRGGGAPNAGDFGWRGAQGREACQRRLEDSPEFDDLKGLVPLARPEPTRARGSGSASRAGREQLAIGAQRLERTAQACAA